jgi:hypothetical protein
MSLASIKKSNANQRPRRTLLYAVKGIGKSTFAAQYPAPIFIATEDGLHDLAVDQFPLCRSWEELRTCAFSLATEEHKYRTVVIDTVDWGERLAWASLCEKEGKENVESCSGGFNKGFSTAVNMWKPIVDCLQYLNTSKGMAVVLLAHSGLVKINDPAIAEPYDKHGPRLHKHLADMLTEWVDEVLFAKYETFTTKGGKGEKAKAIGGTNRLLYTTDCASHTGKNRLGLPESMPLDYATYSAAVAERVAAIHGSTANTIPTTTQPNESDVNDAHS